MIPIANPWIDSEEVCEVQRVLESGMLAQGAVVTQFERDFADYCGVEHAIATNSGTAALHAALLAAGIGAGDEVIVPSFTFFATASAVSMCGARPVFADIDADTFNISPDAIADRITPRTKAVIGVHLFGQPFDIAPVQELCADHDLVLIEDCAQAHGARYKGRKVGGFGKIGCFSFYPTKNMTTGEGGMITTDDAGIAERARRLVNHGQSEKYLHTELGYNYRMTNISAAIGSVQLRKLDRMNDLRRRHARHFSQTISRTDLRLPWCDPQAFHVYHQFVLTVTDEFPMSRDDFGTRLQIKGIGTAVHYPIPVHQQPLYRTAGDGPCCPVAETCAQRVLSIPVHPQITDTDCEYISRTINEVQ
ncbi:MAG: DegT/DnrJ/EryC1/StrS family aminotransferase [Methanomicrobiaceae archaeon]|nr:DegT/DnrJ/EryC1/StrS family aminotransferase [Methanomicrobiaceae archaeon]